MKIGLDFDGTISADPELFSIFALAAIERGHEVKVVTLRPDHRLIPAYTEVNRDVVEWSTRHGLEVIYTSGDDKIKFYQADVWIDDLPEFIGSRDLSL